MIDRTRVPIETFDIPAHFPVSEFPETLQYVAGIAQKITQAPFELSMITLLESLATTYQGAFDVEGLNGKPIPLSLYTLAIAMSGEGTAS